MVSQRLDQLFLRFPWLISGSWFTLFPSIPIFLALPWLTKHGYIYQALIFIIGTGILGGAFGSLFRDLVIKSRHRPVYGEIVIAGGLIFLFSLGLTAFSFSILYYKRLDIGMDIFYVASSSGWAVIALLFLGWIVALLGGFASFSLSKICSLHTISSEILTPYGQTKSIYSSEYVGNTLQRFIEKEYQLYIFMNGVLLTSILFCILILTLPVFFIDVKIIWYLSKILFYFVQIVALSIFPLVPFMLFLSYLCRDNSQRATGRKIKVIQISQIFLVLIWILVCFYLGFMAVFSVSGPG